MKNRHPVHTMVFTMVTSDSDIMPLFIFSRGLKAEAFIKSQYEVVLYWIERVTAWRPYIWQTGVCTMSHKQ